MIIRKGVKEDLPHVLDLIKELAEYERAPHEVDNTLERMEKDGFGDTPVFGFHVAEVDREIVGITLYYNRYSTWKGKCLYLEDLVVNEKYRGSGIGKKLFDVTVSVALETDCRQLNWQVLDWNEPAINLYKKLGSHFDGEWINCKLTREQLASYIA